MIIYDAINVYFIVYSLVKLNIRKKETRIHKAYVQCF